MTKYIGGQTNSRTLLMQNSNQTKQRAATEVVCFEGEGGGVVYRRHKGDAGTDHDPKPRLHYQHPEA